MKELSCPFPTVESFGGGLPGHLRTRRRLHSLLSNLWWTICMRESCQRTQPRPLWTLLYAPGLRSPDPETDSFRTKARSRTTV